MTQFIQLLVNGIVLGAIYSLIAVGLSLVFGVMRVINIAHGDFAMLGAYVAFFAWNTLGLNPIEALIPAMLVLFVIGALIQKTLVERVVNHDEIASLMLTFGVSLLIANSSDALFSTSLRGVPYLSQTTTVFGITLSDAYATGFVLAAVIGLALYAFLRFSTYGKMVRATSQNPTVALACGINVRRVRILAFGLGAALAAAAGVIVSMTGFIYPEMGEEYLPKAFCIVVLGGLGSIPGAVIAALIYGVLESLGTAWLTASIAPALPFVLLVIIMIMRPSGIFGKTVER